MTVMITGSVPQMLLREVVSSQLKQRKRRVERCVRGCGRLVEDSKNTNLCNKCIKKMLG
jgi:hypothetical protein